MGEHHHHPLLLGPAPRHRLRVVVEGEDADHDLGTFVGSVVGSGARRVYATWGYSWEPEGCDPVDETMACTLGAPVGEVRAFPSQRVLARLSGALLPVQMEGDRIALAAPDGAARVLGLDGVVRADVPAARARSVAVVGDRLVTLRRGSPTLDVWDAATGAAITSIPLARGATGRLDAARVHGDAWVAYRTGASVRAVRLADARSVIVARTPAGRQVTDVQLESPGIAWTTARGPARAPRATVLRFARLPDPPPAPSA